MIGDERCCVLCRGVRKEEKGERGRLRRKREVMRGIERGIVLPGMGE